MKCETCQKRSYRSPALHPLQRALHHLQDKCLIIRGGGKTEKEGGGGGEVAILQENGEVGGSN